jgi:hypothetical protein
MKKRICKAIQLCRWCGRLNTLHDVNRGCSVTPAMRRALVDYAREHGRTWRSQLSMLWLTDGDVDEPLLRAIRNIIGPSGLYKIKVPT